MLVLIRNVLLNMRVLFKPSACRPQAGRPARAWFLKIDPVRIVGMHACGYVCVCQRPRLLITSGMMWRDVDLI